MRKPKNCYIVPAIFLLSCIFSGCGADGNFNWRPDPSFGIDKAAHRVLLAGSTPQHGYLASYDLSSKRFKVLFFDPKWISDPSASLDGSKVIFSKTDPNDGTAHIYMCLSDGTRQVRLTNGDVFDSAPVFSNDGRSVYFRRALEQQSDQITGTTWNKFDLYRCDLIGRSAKRITFFDSISAESPAVSPAGDVYYGYDVYDNAKVRDVVHWLRITESTPKEIKGIDSYQVCPSPFDSGLYYADGSSFDPDIWTVGKDRKRYQVTRVRMFIQQFGVLDRYHIIILGEPYRLDTKHNTLTGTTDIDQALLEICVPEQTVRTLVTVERVSNPPLAAGW